MKRIGSFALPPEPRCRRPVRLLRGARSSTARAGSQPSAPGSCDCDAAVRVELRLGLVRVGLVWRS